MRLYHIRHSRSLRVRWLLEELGVPYQMEELPFDPRALQTQDYTPLEAFGKVPVLVDGSVSMTETVAIVQYLLDRYSEGRLQPDRRAEAYGLFLQWLQFGETTLMGPLTDWARHTHFLPAAERDPQVAGRALRTLRQCADIMDRQLSTHPYLVDEQFTAADIVVSYGLIVLDAFGLVPEGLPAGIAAWYERLKARPAFRRAAA